MEPFLIPIAFAALVLDLILSALFVPVYFRFGPVVFRRSFSSGLRFNHIPHQHRLEDLGYSRSAAPFRVRQLDENAFAIRESLWSFRLFNYTPLFHGLIEFDRSSMSIHITGRPNLFPVFFGIAFLSISLNPPDLTFVLFFSFLFGILYYIQSHRYAAFGNRILQAVTQTDPQPSELDE